LVQARRICLSSSLDRRLDTQPARACIPCAYLPECISSCLLTANSIGSRIRFMASSHIGFQLFSFGYGSPAGPVARLRVPKIRRRPRPNQAAAEYSVSSLTRERAANGRTLPPAFIAADAGIQPLPNPQTLIEAKAGSRRPQGRAVRDRRVRRCLQPVRMRSVDLISVGPIRLAS
jgi:hypothetical protein